MTCRCKSAIQAGVSQHKECFVRYIESNNFDGNESDLDDKTLLHYASEWGHLNCLKILIDSNVDIDYQDDFGWTALEYASRDGHKEAISFLLDHGADPEVTDILGQSPLNWAEEKGHHEIVDLIRSYITPLDMKEPGCD